MSSAMIRKSIRLSPKDSQALLFVSQKTSIPQTALMKKWIKEGIQAQKLELALEAYIQRKTDLRGGAKMADVSYNRFAQEIEERRIIVLDDDGGFLERLQFLADAFDDEILREATREVVEQSNSEQPSHQTA
jgi:predicted HTH domain antitoxin